jgi:myotubularin-related protein 3/4
MVDSINENTSVCSWEAVDERSAPSSGSNSATQQQLQQQILWVPDHAVNRCQGCQIEFWLGRRKHHCRSCGNIFCADCSEFWAPLPDERLFTPVRLCASCYQSVTGKFQVCALIKQSYRRSK